MVPKWMLDRCAHLRVIARTDDSSDPLRAQIVCLSAAEEAIRLGNEAATIMQDMQTAHRDTAHAAKEPFKKIAKSAPNMPDATPCNS